MVCVVSHDGQRVTRVRPEFHRVPMSTCSGAGEVLQQVVGMPVGSDFSTFFADARARQNCTHMFDLAWLGTVHAARGETIRDYVIEIPDETPEGHTVEVRRDGEIALRWRLVNDFIVEPESHSGQHLFRGYITWAMRNYSGDDLEAALLLQKACFVAQTRRYDLPTGLLSPEEQKRNTGLCFGFAAERIGEAVRLDGVLRNVADPDQLLKFR